MYRSWEHRVRITLKGCWVIARKGILFPVRGYRYHHKFRVKRPGKGKHHA